MKLRLFGLVFLPLLLCSRTSAQNVIGTVTVFGHSLHKIVLAADSFNGAPNARGEDQSLCKFAVLDKTVVFTGSGLAAHIVGPHIYWHVYLAAALAYEKAKPTVGSTRLRNATVLFADILEKSVQQALVDDPAGTKKLIEFDENRIFNGLFAGFENNRAEMYQAEVFYDPSSKQIRQKLDVFKQYDDMTFGAGGRNDTAVEVLEGQTDFAKRELGKWAMFSQGIPPRDKDVYWAMRLIELTMAYDRNRMWVGGPIDSLVLTATGIRWIQCKPQCDNIPLKLSDENRKAMEKL